MAIKKYRDTQEYQGVTGSVRKYLDAGTSDGRIMKRAIKEDFTRGAFWVTSNHEPVMLFPIAFGGFAALIGGFMHMNTGDHVDFNELSQSGYSYSQTAEQTANSFTILRSSDERPYLITTNDDGSVTMYQAHSTAEAHYRLIPFNDGWEWDVLSSTDAYQALNDIITTSGELETASESVHVSSENIYVQSYESEGITVPYTESDVFRISSGEITNVEHLKGETLDSLTANLENVQQDIVEGQYRQFTTAKDVKEFDQSTLNPFASTLALYSIGSVLGLMGTSGTINAAHTAVFRRRKKTNVKGPSYGG